MKAHRCATLVALAIMASQAFAQSPTPVPLASQELPASSSPSLRSENSIPSTNSNTDSPLDKLSRDAAQLHQVASVQQSAGADQQKQIEILQKQVETQQKMIQLLADQLKKLATPGASLQKLEDQTATLEARGLQAAERDVEIARAIDNIAEHQDAVERYGPQLPAHLKELFLPGGNNETPLSIYGALAFGYTKIQGTPGGFYFGEFTPDFLLRLNDWIFMEAEIGIGADGSVAAGSFAQADFILNDWLTVVAGRFVLPMAWYNERLNNPWINKLPGDAPGSAPLLWMQVLPPAALLGAQARGAFYLGNSPVKMEYAAYLSNGLNLIPATAGAPTYNEVANLENMTNTFNITSTSKMVGGRVGLWWPAVGVAGGISGLYNGSYVPGFNDAMSIWAVDLNYHKGNWDFRAEYGANFQQAYDFIGNNIRREGMYAQIAYRPRDCEHKYLQNLEFIYRYGYVSFRGIDSAQLDPTTFATPVDVPVLRQQSEVGIDYWFSPRLVAKVAYQRNTQPGYPVQDNNFMAEMAWGW